MLYINFICDACEETEGDKTVQPVNFDSMEESFGNLISYMRGIDWIIDIDSECKVIRAECPRHHKVYE